MVHARNGSNKLKPGINDHSNVLNYKSSMEVPQINLICALKSRLMTRHQILLLIFLFSITTARSQWISFQSVKIEYDSRGNRILRKLYDPGEIETKRSDNEQVISGNGIVAFPNPAGKEVTLQLNQADSQTVSLLVYNATGQQVYSTTLLSGNRMATINLQYLPAGIYHIHAITASYRRSINIIHE